MFAYVALESLRRSHDVVDVNEFVLIKLSSHGYIPHNVLFINYIFKYLIEQPDYLSGQGLVRGIGVVINHERFQYK